MHLVFSVSLPCKLRVAADSTKINDIFKFIRNEIDTLYDGFTFDQHLKAGIIRR